MAATVSDYIRYLPGENLILIMFREGQLKESFITQYIYYALANECFKAGVEEEDKVKVVIRGSEKKYNLKVGDFKDTDWDHLLGDVPKGQMTLV